MIPFIEEERWWRSKSGASSSDEKAMSRKKLPKPVPEPVTLKVVVPIQESPNPKEPTHWIERESGGPTPTFSDEAYRRIMAPLHDFLEKVNLDWDDFTENEKGPLIRAWVWVFFKGRYPADPKKFPELVAAADEAHNRMEAALQPVIERKFGKKEDKAKAQPSKKATKAKLAAGRRKSQSPSPPSPS
jgi:hypothetical protein